VFDNRQGQAWALKLHLKENCEKIQLACVIWGFRREVDEIAFFWDFIVNEFLDP
jgi:hypothetical protein